MRFGFLAWTWGLKTLTILKGILGESRLYRERRLGVWKQGNYGVSKDRHINSACRATTNSGLGNGRVHIAVSLLIILLLLLTDRSDYCIWRFMIDKRFQGRGYGREALKQAVDFIRTFPCGAAEYCVLSCAPMNETAKNLYFSSGFKERNKPGYYEEDDEISAVMKL